MKKAFVLLALLFGAVYSSFWIGQADKKYSWEERFVDSSGPIKGVIRKLVISGSSPRQQVVTIQRVDKALAPRITDSQTTPIAVVHAERTYLIERPWLSLSSSTHPNCFRAVVYDETAAAWSPFAGAIPEGQLEPLASTGTFLRFQLPALAAVERKVNPPLSANGRVLIAPTDLARVDTLSKINSGLCH